MEPVRLGNGTALPNRGGAKRQQRRGRLVPMADRAWPAKATRSFASRRDSGTGDQLSLAIYAG